MHGRRPQEDRSGPQADRADEEHEVRSWTESLKCTEEELRAAVKAVGNSAEKVREYLRKK
ncbi:MAG: DUF3606 domain-containing protein [Variovorax sp.]|nr:MAG: DUF3606 domain-containing protein [Variovorax sp.]